MNTVERNKLATYNIMLSSITGGDRCNFSSIVTSFGMQYGLKEI